MSHCRLRIAHAHCLQFERSGMVLMSHIREASKVIVQLLSTKIVQIGDKSMKLSQITNMPMGNIS
jgi:hypothetical protein